MHIDKIAIKIHNIHIIHHNLKPETIIPNQEAVSASIDDVHEAMAQGRVDLGKQAMSALLSAGSRINYRAIGQADNDTFEHMQALLADVVGFADERKKDERWLHRQHGATLTPRLAQNIVDTQKRIDRIQAKSIPGAEAKIEAYRPTVEEVESIAEVTGEAWPYYPALSPNQPDYLPVNDVESEESMSEDSALRMTIQNDIARLSYDSRGGLGIKYNTLTALWFNERSEAEKSDLAKALAAMIRDGEVRIRDVGSVRYIESLLATQTRPSEAEKKEEKLVTVLIELDSELAKTLIKAVHSRYRQEGYRRIERDEMLELQIPLVFAHEFAKRNGLMLAKHGPSGYRLLRAE